jgi:hypothetical protein
MHSRADHGACPYAASSEARGSDGTVSRKVDAVSERREITGRKEHRCGAGSAGSPRVHDPPSDQAHRPATSLSILSRHPA